MSTTDLSVEEHQQLTGGGECQLHHHQYVISPKDMDSYQSLRKIREVNTTSLLEPTDDIVIVDTAGSSVDVQLPISRGGKEYTIVKKSALNSLNVTFSLGQTCFGDSSVLATNKGAVVRLKAYKGNWILI